SFGGGLALLFAFAAAFLLPQFTIRRGHAAAFWIGIVVMIAGSLLRRHCFRMLGQYFTGNVQVLPDQRVVERGAYRLVRHPAYTAGMLMFLGMALALGNWLSVAVLFATTLATYLYRVRVEERALLATIGEPYRLYM